MISTFFFLRNSSLRFFQRKRVKVKLVFCCKVDILFSASSETSKKEEARLSRTSFNLLTYFCVLLSIAGKLLINSFEKETDERNTHFGNHSASRACEKQVTMCLKISSIRRVLCSSRKDDRNTLGNAGNTLHNLLVHCILDTRMVVRSIIKMLFSWEVAGEKKHFLTLFFCKGFCLMS